MIASAPNFEAAPIQQFPIVEGFLGRWRPRQPFHFVKICQFVTICPGQIGVGITGTTMDTSILEGIFLANQPPTATPLDFRRRHALLGSKARNSLLGRRGDEQGLCVRWKAGKPLSVLDNKAVLLRAFVRRSFERPGWKCVPPIAPASQSFFRKARRLATASGIRDRRVHRTVKAEGVLRHCAALEPPHCPQAMQNLGWPGALGRDTRKQGARRHNPGRTFHE